MGEASERKARSLVNKGGVDLGKKRLCKNQRDLRVSGHVIILPEGPARLLRQQGPPIGSSENAYRFTEAVRIWADRSAWA